MEKNSKLIIYTYGEESGDSIPSSYSFVICNSENQILKEGVRSMGEATKNSAEAQAVIAALREAASIGADEVLLASDGKIVVDCMMGRYCVKKPHFLPMSEELLSLTKRFKHVAFESANRRDPMMARAIKMVKDQKHTQNSM